MADEKKEEKPEKTPEKVKLYGGIEYWSKIMVHMDKKLEAICKGYGYGEMGLTIVIHRGKIMYTLFTDQIKIKENHNEE